MGTATRVEEVSRAADAPAARAAEHDEGRHVGLFWRLFIPNAMVLGTACGVLILEPPQGRVGVLAAGLAVMLGVNLAILRRAVRPLLRLTEVMRHVDVLVPGQRVPPTGPPSEVTLLADAFNEMLDRLEAERAASGRRALSEVEAERRRLAAELHDQIGQSLTAVSLHLARIAAARGEPPGGELHEVREEVLRAVEEVRDLARQLRPEALDALGLVPALTNLADRLAQRTGVTVRRRLARDLPALSHDAELVVYRVAQESLTNALRHAGPTAIDVELGAVDDGVLLVVADDGHGIDRTGGGDGTGIRSMRERALAVGADLRIRPRPSGRGTEVSLYVPAAG